MTPKILATEGFRWTLSDALVSARSHVVLVSAYVTKIGMEWIAARLKDDGVSCSIITRWSPHDLIAGASDIEAFEIAQERRWNFHIMQDLHAKLYLIDDRHLLFGSANLTGSGLRLVPGGNREIGTKIVPSKEDLSVVNGFFDEAILLDDELYQTIKDWLQSVKKDRDQLGTIDWPPSIAEKLSSREIRLWVEDLFWTDHTLFEWLSGAEMRGNETRAVQHDLSLLGFDPYIEMKINDDELCEAFLHSKAWMWLQKALMRAEKRELYFGALTAHLHNSLLNDPTPYRRTVKQLIANLLSWIQHLNPPGIEIDRPNHSMRIRLIGSQ